MDTVVIWVSSSRILAYCCTQEVLYEKNVKSLRDCCLIYKRSLVCTSSSRSVETRGTMRFAE